MFHAKMFQKIPSTMKAGFLWWKRKAISEHLWEPLQGVHQVWNAEWSMTEKGRQGHML